MDKQSFRLEMSAKRVALSEREADSVGKKICDNLFMLEEFSSAKKIGVYLSVKNEAETSFVIEKLLREKKQVFVPVIEQGELFFVRLRSLEGLVENSFGVPIPKKIERVAARELDLFLVPGLAFDLAGYRLGWGKGFYDKFFSKNKRVMKIGIAYSFQVVEKLPKEKHDVKMDVIVTENEILSSSG